MLAIVPARGGSKGLPGKNIRPLAGKPLIAHTIEAALAEGAPRLLEELGLWSQPGVFSWNRIDPGSDLLVRNLPSLSGKGADFGGGIGVLSRAVLASPKVTRLTLIGAAYISMVCLLPEALIAFYKAPFYLGGTSLLIVVSVTMDTVAQIQSHLLAHQYEGLIKKSRLRGGKTR
jgi:hypothetical protein